MLTSRVFPFEEMIESRIYGVNFDSISSSECFLSGKTNIIPVSKSLKIREHTLAGMPKIIIKFKHV